MADKTPLRYVVDGSGNPTALHEFATGETIAVAHGGTGATTAAGARTNLGAAPIASPAFTDTPTAPTAPPGTNTTQLASTEFVTAAVLAGLASVATVPPGTVIYYAAGIAPSGYLKANGAAVSRSTYAALFSAIGTTFGSGDGSTTFTLPDLRGEFIRGWDDARGIDAGRALGSAQADAFKAHNHGIHYAGVNIAAGSNAGVPLEINAGTPLPTNNGDGGTATETRPRNVALLACIKY